MTLYLISLYVSLNKVFFVGIEKALSGETCGSHAKGTNYLSPQFQQ